jgi:mycothiol synthase
LRPYSGLSDLAVMQDLLRTFPDPFESYPTAADLPEMLDPVASENPSNTVLWEDASGELLGFAIVSQYNNLRFHFQPGSLTSHIERQMMDWAVARMNLRLSKQTERQPLTLDACARDDDAAKVALLERHGFAPTDVQTLYMVRSLHEPFPEPRLPDGFVLRPLAGESEVAAYVAAHRAAYGTSYMTVEERLAIMKQPSYLPELDLVAIAPDGTLAAFCVCSIDEKENESCGRQEGEIAIVGTQPAFRNQGLGQAMVLAGMHSLKEQGMDFATLGVSSANAVAVHVYQTVGFRVRFSKQWYSKAIA